MPSLRRLHYAQLLHTSNARTVFRSWGSRDSLGRCLIEHYLLYPPGGNWIRDTGARPPVMIFIRPGLRSSVWLISGLDVRVFSHAFPDTTAGFHECGRRPALKLQEVARTRTITTAFTGTRCISHPVELICSCFVSCLPPSDFALVSVRAACPQRGMESFAHG